MQIIHDDDDSTRNNEAEYNMQFLLPMVFPFATGAQRCLPFRPALKVTALRRPKESRCHGRNSKAYSLFYLKRHRHLSFCDPNETCGFRAPDKVLF